MTCKKLQWGVTVVVLSMLLSISGHAQQQQTTLHAHKAAAKPAANAAASTFQPGLEPRAIDILKAACARLAAAKTMSFTAVVSYESPSRLGPPLVYSTRSEVTLQRPDKLRVITPGDGPPSEFYYDGKTMTAFAPKENLVAVADAPPTIDAALEVAYHTGAIYFPFSDVIVADPYKDIADGLKIAFYIGQSIVVGGTTTDMVAYVTGDVFVQIWIGAQDQAPTSHLRHLPERSRAVAPRSRTVQLGTGCHRSRGRFRSGQDRGRFTHRVRTPRRSGFDRHEATAENQARQGAMRRRVMKQAVIRLVGLLILAPVAGPAGAWSHADRYGGTASHTPGSQSLTRTDAAGGSLTQSAGGGATATSRYGGTASHQAGSNQTTYNNKYGDSATHTYGQGTTATNAYGGTASHTTGSGYSTYTSASGTTAYHSAYYGAAYPAYHPPSHGEQLRLRVLQLRRLVDGGRRGRRRRGRCRGRRCGGLGQ